MASGAAIAAEAGADLIDINMGCPVRKVRKVGAGAELLRRPDLALALARAVAHGSGRPVTVKLRSGIDPGDRSGVDLAVRLVEEGGVAAIALHPRSAAVQHKGDPDYGLVRDLVERLDGSEAKVIVSGGLATAPDARRAYRESGADAVMIARGALGNPWIFQELTGRRVAEPSDDEIVRELLWTMERAERHMGEPRAARYARKFYPWYLERLGIRGAEANALQRTETLDEARVLVTSLVRSRELAAQAA
jgi:tRNA-dihydrouridine synthase